MKEWDGVVACGDVCGVYKRGPVSDEMAEEGLTGR